MTEYNEPSFPGVFREVEFQDTKSILKKLLQELATWQYGIKVILNKGISRNDNIDQVDVTFTSNATPDTEDSITHTLGKVPEGFRVITKNKAGDIYGTPSLGTAWTKTTIYLKTSVASVTAKIEVF